MLPKKDYDKNTANKFLAEGNYYSLITYLEQFKMDTPAEQSEWDAHLNSIRTKSTIYNSMLNNSDDKDAIKFTTGLQQGYINEETTYGKKYSKTLNDLGSSDNKNATSLKVKFRDNDSYSNFLLNIGISEKDLESKGLKLKEEDGNKSIIINKSNTFIPTLLQGLHDIKPSRISRSIRNISDPYKLAQSNINPYTLDDINLLNNLDEFNVIGLDAEENEIKNANIPIRKLNKLNNIVQRAKDKYDQVNRGDKNEEFVQNQIITSDFKGARHQKLIGYLNNKQIDRNTFNDYEKKIDDFYKSEIANAGFTKYDIYLEGDLNNFTEVTDNEEKLELEALVRSKILNNDNVTYRAAMSGNMFGTMITIGAIPDNKTKQIPEQGKLKNLNTNAQYRIFIPNLFNDDAEKSFNVDTQTRAIKQHYLLKTNNATQYLSDGSSITNITENGGILNDIKTGQQIELSTSEILKYLDREYLLSDAISYYSKEYDDIKNGNNLVIGEGASAIRLGNTKTVDDLGMEIAYKCKVMCKELEPNTNSTAYVNEVFDMYMKILKAIGYEGTPKMDLIRKNNK